MWKRRLGCSLALSLLVVADATEASQGQVATAREHYNDGQFDEAIELADQVWQESASVGAAVVLARSQLERFRIRSDRSDLEAARRLLREVDPRSLSATDRTDWELGIAAVLYLSEDYGPAAEILDRLLREGTASGDDRDRLVDWWASAVDHTGRHLSRLQRAETYIRLVERLEAELSRNPASPAATYWLVEAVRGIGDPERAWNLGVAGWIRAGTGDSALREDLDRLMLQGVIPDLAVSRTSQPFDDVVTIATMAQLAGHWEALKARWESP